MKVAGTRLSAYSILYVCLEDALIVAAFLAALSFGSVPLTGSITVLLFQVTALLLFVNGVFFLAGLYDFRHLPSRLTFWRRMGAGLGPIVLCGAVASLLFDEKAPAVVFFLLLLAAGVVLIRTAFEMLMRSALFRERLLFLGVGSTAQRTARELVEHHRRDYDLVGFLSEDDKGLGWKIGQRPVLGTFENLVDVVEEHGIDKIVVAVEDRRKNLPLQSLLELRLRGTEILEEARIHEETAGKIPVEDLRPSWLIFSEGFSNTPMRNVTKRIFDIVVAAACLLLSAPLALAVALAIRLDSKGPIFFKQLRVGQGGWEFTLYKFRSMRPDAEASGQPQWAQKNDPRVTRVGRILRRTRLDEIPQMWNVLQGSMSFVGPRPERLFFVEDLRNRIPYYDQRHVVKPGITGWAQVRFRYCSDDSDAVEKLRHDMYYIKHHSILFDLRILLETIKVVLRGELGR
ncbi:MAG: TIGR03013 family PEP-CTERM/XrtA system glycosyltransferase [Planctomycetota bacterium]|nr:TIGR03013 family PEP-CTERM/XrtA system glycosyltransferase [Planctomycetota bacterium]